MSNKGLPAMGFFVQRMARIDEAESYRDYLSMYRLLLSTSDDFHKKDRKSCENTRKKLEEYIKEIESKNGRNHNHTLQIRRQVGTYLYNNGGREAKLKIYDQLWAGGYISVGSFNSFFDPSGGRKSGSSDHKGFPARVKAVE